MILFLSIHHAACIPASGFPESDLQHASRSCNDISTNITTIRNSKLPSPFVFLNKTAPSNANDWACRRSEISSMIQTLELGPKPPAPTLTATLSGSKLSITLRRPEVYLLFCDCQASHFPDSTLPCCHWLRGWQYPNIDQRGPHHLQQPGHCSRQSSWAGQIL